ncbi:trypsin-like peptidase domain-containing protein [Streptomyces olivaceoviridis]|uniref:trypsin-like peptidase domain-containing protein n=1 Tax=Streptomyces olivaceoviridis TaxID=1921 RepID=UPI0033A0A3E1
MTLARLRLREIDELQNSAVWISAGGSLRGSGFLMDEGIVVTAAHVVVDETSPNSDLVVHHASGDYPVLSDQVRAEPSAHDGSLFYPYPDLAALQVPGLSGRPVPKLAAVEAEPSTELTALGYSGTGPMASVQVETLMLRAAGRSGPYLRLLGDGLRPGHSGSMLLNPDGLVCGVLKGSRSYSDDQGGWSASVAALTEFLGIKAAGTVSPTVRPPTDAEIVEALMAFPALARPDRRYDLLDKMGDHLRLPHSFEADERPERRDHLYRIVYRCRHYRDSSAALTSLYTAIEELVPYDAALEKLRVVIGNAVGGWEST